MLPLFKRFDALPQAQSRAMQADLLWARGSKLLERKKFARAIEAMRAALEIEPSRLEGRLNLGAALFLSGAFEEALTHLKYVLSFEPQNSMALLNLAACYDAMGMMEQSIATLELLVGARPAWKDAHYNLAVAYYKCRIYDKAESALKTELKLNPHNEAARTLLNKIYLMPRKVPQ